METVKQLIQMKMRHQGVLSIAPDARVHDALEMMAREDVGALVVLEEEKPVGIITERDFARKVILKGNSSLDVPVRQLMTGNVICIESTQTTEACMALITEKRVRHLPVMEGGRLIGVVSIGDLVKGVIGDKEFFIEQLVSYIHR